MFYLYVKIFEFEEFEVVVVLLTHISNLILNFKLIAQMSCSFASILSGIQGDWFICTNQMTTQGSGNIWKDDKLQSVTKCKADLFNCKAY